MRTPCYMCVYVPPLQSLNQVTDFHKTWYECYATGGHTIAML